MGYSVQPRSRERPDPQTEYDKKHADYNPAPEHKEQRYFDCPRLPAGIEQHHYETRQRDEQEYDAKQDRIGSPEFDWAIDHFGHFMRIFLTR